MRSLNRFLRTTALAAGLAALVALPAAADFVINDDLIVDGSACIGFDCVNGEVFSFDTIRLKENNLRIKFDDTSTVPSFPANDWQLTANESSNGGLSKFSIEDVSGARTPFTIEANARTHSLYVDDGGRIGIRTNSPSVEVHVIDGDTPTLRLQQDGSSGFGPQTWDVAGNETNFFIRDVTNGSTLPFRIRPQAPSNSIFIDVDGDVGMGTSSPDSQLHISDTDAKLHVQGSATGVFELRGGTVSQFRVIADGNSARRIQGRDTSGTQQSQIILGNNGSFVFAGAATPANDVMTIDSSGNVVITGNCSDAPGGGGCTADYVFEPDYELMPLDELAEFVAENKHLPNVPPAEETRKNGLNLSAMNGRLLEKIEELTLYTLQLHRNVQELAAVKQENGELKSRLEQLERSIAGAASEEAVER